MILNMIDSRELRAEYLFGLVFPLMRNSIASDYLTSDLETGSLRLLV